MKNNWLEMNVKKIIVISDTHLGEKECLLKMDNKLLTKFINRIVSKETIDGKKIDELIIIGDLFELAYVSFRDAYKEAKEFFKRISAIENLERIIYLPGNHDHHIWSIVTEMEQLVEIVEQGNLPMENLERVNICYEDTFLNKLTDKKLIVAYPNLVRIIEGKRYFFHHGHLMQIFFTPSRLLIKPDSLYNLETLNSHWLDFLWYWFSTDRTLREFEETLYKKGLLKLMIFVEKITKIIVKFLNLKGYEVRSLRGRIENYLNLCITSEKDIPDYFVFGHTHRKSSQEGEELKFKFFDKEERLLRVFNTGGWNDQKNKNQACYFVFEAGEPPRLEIFYDDPNE